MDINCPKCGKPWDVDELHEVEGHSFREAHRIFAKSGCALFGTRCSEVPDLDKAAMSRAAYDVLGDDVDGIASMMEDL